MMPVVSYRITEDQLRSLESGGSAAGALAVWTMLLGVAMSSWGNAISQAMPNPITTRFVVQVSIASSSSVGAIIVFVVWLATRRRAGTVAKEIRDWGRLHYPPGQNIDPTKPSETST
jgi:hypothetical protein